MSRHACFSRLTYLLALFASCALSVGAVSQQIPVQDSVRVHEFYRLASAIQDQIWPDWSKTPTPLLLITTETEFLSHHPKPPEDFKPVDDGFYARPRQFSIQLEATFPAFGPPAVIVIGEPQNTKSKTSTPWLIVVMHEHFHQLQMSMPEYFSAIEGLGLGRGDKTGMWMLNYPFPYDRPDVMQSFGKLRDLLLTTVNEKDPVSFRKDAAAYLAMRKRFFALLSADDHRYLSFQLWQEGVARYTEIEVAEAAASYKSTEAFAALGDYEPFNVYAARARSETVDQLRVVDLAQSKRSAVYSFGAVEGMLLDRLNPQWKQEYFKHLLSTDELFDVTVPGS